MKTIIIKSNGDFKKLQKVVEKLENYTDYHVENAVICTRYIDTDNYNTVMGEMKDATSLNDFDLFIVGVVNEVVDTTALKTVNKAHTLVCDVTELDSAKNFVIML